MDKVRVGFIGAGQISQLHARGYLNNPTGELAAVADARPEVAQQRAEEYGAGSWTADYHELLDNPDIDAVEILLPHHLHRQVSIEALAAGKHVSLQKPFALNLAEADAVIDAARSSGRIFRVFENFRYYEPYRLAKRLVDEGEIGDPLSIRVKVIGGRGVGGWVQPEDARRWRRVPATGGGPPAIFDHGYHVTSIVNYFMGPVARVHSMVDTSKAGTAGYEGVPAMITWQHADSSTYGSWEIVRAPDLLVRTEHYSEDEWLEITGSRGIIWVTRCSGDLLGEAPVMLHRDGQTTRFTDMDAGWASSFVSGAHDFTASIVAGRQPPLDGVEARHALEFCLAAMQSAEERREVTLGG